MNHLSSIVLRQFSTGKPLRASKKMNLFALNFDRRIKVDYQESIRYMDSEAYKKTYHGHLVWRLYRRNHKNQFPREGTRPSCVNAEGFVDTSYPCPICRDEYLVLHPENAKLLGQFIDPYTGEIITRKNHGLCLRQYRNLIIAILQAQDLGTLVYHVPERMYNYKEYYEQ